MSQLALLKYLTLEVLAPSHTPRVPEPDLIMADPGQAAAFMDAGREDGSIAPTYLFHTLQLSQLIRPGDRVLDLACGPANQLAQVARVNPEAHFLGVDASASMLELARETVARQALTNVEFMAGYIQSLPDLPDGGFDLVMSTMSLHHLPDTATLAASFREAARLLKPGGALYLADFARLKRDSSRRYLVERSASGQSEIFRTDFLNSLRAAFSVEEFRDAIEAAFGKYAQVIAMKPVPVMLVVQQGDRRALSSEVLAQCVAIFQSLNTRQQFDFQDLQRFFKLGGLANLDIKNASSSISRMKKPRR